MADSRTPHDLAARLGDHTETKFVDLEKGIYLFENTLSSTYQLFLLEGVRWEWAMCARTGAELAGMARLMRRLGVDIDDTSPQTTHVPAQSQL